MPPVAALRFGYRLLFLWAWRLPTSMSDTFQLTDALADALAAFLWSRSPRGVRSFSWGYTSGQDVKFQVELLSVLPSSIPAPPPPPPSSSSSSALEIDPEAAAAAVVVSAAAGTATAAAAAYNYIVVRLVQGAGLEAAQRQLQQLGLQLRTAFGIE